MKKHGHCPDYMTIPLDDPSMLELNASPYGEQLATIFVNRQSENSPMYSICDSLANGTVYPALFRPYESSCCKPGGDGRG